MASTESTAEPDSDAEQWHCSSRFGTEETLAVEFTPSDLSLVFIRTDLTVENIYRVLNYMEESEYQIYKLFTGVTLPERSFRCQNKGDTSINRRL